MNILNDIKQTFKIGSVLTKLIYINIGVFLLIKILGVLLYLGGQPNLLVEWLAIPSNKEFLLNRFWTPITYMFLHVGFLHLLFNILGLYWFGKLFLYHLEGEKLLAVYLLGGLSGAGLYLLAYNVLPVFSGANSILLGASASVYAVLVAAAFYDPERQIMLPLVGSYPLKYVAAFYILLSVIGVSSTNAGGNIAHLGGAVWGWFYITRLQKGTDMGSGLVRWLSNLSKIFDRSSRMRVTHRQAPRDDYEYNREKNKQQDEINRILDKIAKSGYDSLTKSEKEILFKQGKK